MNRNKLYRTVLLAWLALLLMFPALSRVVTEVAAYDQATPAMMIACTTGGSGNDCGGVTGGGGG